MRKELPIDVVENFEKTGEKPVVVEKNKEPNKVREGYDAKGRFVHQGLTTINEVEEEHLYLFYHGPTKDVIIECDLLGTQEAIKSDGKIPPTIHIECPECTKPDDRSALSITYTNRPFEIEDLDIDDWYTIEMPDGSPILGTNKKPIILSKKLTVKDPFRCTYCNRKYRITDNHMTQEHK